MQLPDHDTIAEYCRSNGIRRLALFGSRAAGTSDEHSDIDLLIEFEPGSRAGLLTIARLERELAVLFGGTVDLRTPADLSRYFRDNVTKSAKPIFEAA